MGIAESKITAQGQISVPAKIREKLGLAPGSILEWCEQEGRIFVRRASKCTAEDIHRAVFGGAPPKKSYQQMDQGIRDRMKLKHERR